MLQISPTSQFKLSQSLSLRLVPQRLYLFKGRTPPVDASLGRLFKLSVQNLLGYRAVKDAGLYANLTTFADVVAAQRNAQCRQLATMVRYIDSTAVGAAEEAAVLGVIWKKALLELERDNLRRFSSYVSIAEQRLEYAFLAEANKGISPNIREQLHGIAVNVFSARDRLEELMREVFLEFV